MPFSCTLRSQRFASPRGAGPFRCHPSYSVSEVLQEIQTPKIEGMVCKNNHLEELNDSSR